MQLRRSWQKTQETNQLPFPATSGVRTALLGSTCISFHGLATFAEGRWRDLCAFGPQALVGSTPVMMRAAAAMFRGELPLPTLDCAVFVLTELGTPVLSEADREVLWRAFLVPVFELCVDRSGNLIAAECEAHDGWHLADPKLEFLTGGTELFIRRRGSPGTEMRTGMKAERAPTSCCCGNHASLIRNIRMLQRVPAPSLAATA
jgi:uncharacterized protein YjhX (UPF0386 family)